MITLPGVGFILGIVIALGVRYRLVCQQLEGRQLVSGGSHIAAEDAGAAQPKGFGDRLPPQQVSPANSHRRGSAAARPHRRPPPLQPMVGHQGHFGPGLAIPDVGYYERKFLICEVDRTPLPASPRGVRGLVRPRVARPSQHLHVLLEDLLNRLQSQRNRRLNERDSSIEDTPCEGSCSMSTVLRTLGLSTYRCRAA